MSSLRTCEEFLKNTYVGYWEQAGGVSLVGPEITPYLGLTEVCVGDLMGVLTETYTADQLVDFGEFDYQTLFGSYMRSFYIPPNFKMTAYNTPRTYKAEFFGPALHILEGSQCTRPTWRDLNGRMVLKTFNRAQESLPVLGNPLADPSHTEEMKTKYSGFDLHIHTLQFERQHIHRELHKKPNAPPSWETQTLSMCLGTTFSVLGVPLSRYQPHTTGCDNIMLNFCTGDNLQDPDCACIREERTLQEEHPTIKLPVTCYGADCASGGYRTASMMNQQCSLTLCQQTIEANGHDLSVGGKNTIYCAGTFFKTTTALPVPVVDVADEVTPTPTRAQDQSVPVFVWILFGLGIAMFGILMYFVINSTKIKK